MVYKKFIKRDGKTFGPYFYENYRVGNVTKTRYLGLVNKKDDYEKKEKKVWGNLRLGFILGIVAVVLLVGLLFILRSNVTGNASLDLTPSYLPGESLQGNLKLTLEQDEFIPAETRVVIELNDKSYAYSLNELVSEQVSSGNFNVNGKDITGSGEGYGVTGENTEVSFVLEVFPPYSSPDLENNFIPSTHPELPSSADEELNGSASEQVQDASQEDNINVDNSVNDGSANSGSVNEDNPVNDGSTSVDDNVESTNNNAIDSVIDSNINSNEAQTVNNNADDTTSNSDVNSESSSSEPSSSESSSESSADSGSMGITGNVVESSSREIEGSVSSTKEFTYTLEEGETASVKSGSVSSGEDNDISLSVNGNQVTATLKNKANQESQGKELLIDLSKLNIKAENGELKITLSYNGNEIVSASEEISVESVSEVIPENETIIETNVTIIPKNETIIVNETEIPELNETEILNETIIINETEINASSLRLIKRFSDLDILKNENYTLNLEEYFENAKSYSVAGADETQTSMIIDGREVPYDVYLKKKRLDELMGVMR